MNTMDENNLTEVPEDQHILDTKNTKKRDKKGENISFKNLKSSIIFKASSNSKKKLNHKLKQHLPNSNPKKKVKFNDDIIIIDIECWKEYNLEQTADENIEDFNVESNSNEETNIKKKEKKSKNKGKKNNNNKENNISCTCLII